MNGSFAGILNGILTTPTTTNPTAPLGEIFQVGSFDLGLTLGNDTTAPREFMLTLMYVRFAATVAGTGYPVACLYDATYKTGAATATYAAASVYSVRGISTSIVAAAGDYGWIQVGGLNGWPITAAGACAQGDLLYWSNTNEVTAAASDANRIKGFAVCEKLIGGAGAFGVGDVRLINRF